MSNIAISLASLVKSNKGLFKSEKQSAFLLSMCSNNEYYARTLAGSTLVYLLDSNGVLKVTKITTKKTSIEFDRNIDPNIAHSKRIKRLINATLKSIKEREEAQALFIERGSMDLYNRAMQIDKDNLASYEQHLRELEL